MVQQLLAILAPMLLGTQLILTLILIKGDICPGQRGRIHKVIPAIAILWLVFAPLNLGAILVVLVLAYFYSQVQTKKTRKKGPIWALYLADSLALLLVVMMVFEQSTIASGISVIVQISLLGALFAHLLLAVARSRLQAFHRILPVVGVISAMGMSLAIGLQALSLDEQVLMTGIEPLLIGFALMISAIVIWCWHMLLVRDVSKLQLGLSLVVMIIAISLNQALFVL